MARPKKTGLEYFPLDANMDLVDDDMKILQTKHGNDGFVILIKLYMKIYSSNGYYYKWGEKESILHANRCNCDINKVIEVVNDLIEWDIFNKKLFNEHSILTSRRIQETYMEATSKRTNVDMDKSFLCVNEVKSNINLINVTINPQSKVNRKESKEKKIINNYSSDSNEYRLASYLFDFIKKNNPNAKEPNMQNWAKIFDYILRLDKRSIEEVERIIEFSQKDDFWYKNILSPSKLRKQYDRLFLEMKDKSKKADKQNDNWMNWKEGKKNGSTRKNSKDADDGEEFVFVPREPIMEWEGEGKELI